MKRYHAPLALPPYGNHVGKTHFLWYLLRYRLSRQLPTIFSLGGSPVYFFHNTGVYEPISYFQTPGLLNEAVAKSNPELVWSLIDRLDEKTGPLEMVWGGDLFPVHTSAPDLSLFQTWAEV